MTPIQEKGLGKFLQYAPTKQQILDCFQFKATKEIKFKIGTNEFQVFDRKETIVGKGENADYQHFLPFPMTFSEDLFLNIIW